jgi:hypothetical protein
LDIKWGLGIGDWGLGIGDWGLGPIPNPQFYIIYIFYILLIFNSSHVILLRVKN